MVNSKTGVELVKEWLEKYGLIDFVSEITSEKPRAKIYIDDNEYRFESWEKTLNDMRNSLKDFRLEF